MKSLERMIGTMHDDLKDSGMLFEKAKEARYDNNTEECDMYLSRAKQRIEMFDKDVTNINNMMKDWETEEMKDMSETEKKACKKIKEIYMKFYHHSIRKGDELKKAISDYKNSY